MSSPAPPDADVRLGGTWGPGQRRKNDLIFAAAQAALGAARRAPGWALRLACAGLGVACWALLGSARRRVGRNLRRAFGARAPSPLRVFLALGASLEDTLALLRGGAAIGPRLAFPEASRRVFREAAAAGRGVVLATAHLGPWERLGAALIEAGLPAATVARESYDPRFQGLYGELREGRGLRVLYRGAPGFVAALRRALRGGMIVGMPMDLGGRGVRALEVPFLGGALPLALGPAELALRTGAALVVATPAPDEAGGLQIHAEPVKVEGDAAALTRTLARRLEQRLQALPCPWPWMHHEMS